MTLCLVLYLLSGESEMIHDDDSPIGKHYVVRKLASMGEGCAQMFDSNRPGMFRTINEHNAKCSTMSDLAHLQKSLIFGEYLPKASSSPTKRNRGSSLKNPACIHNRAGDGLESFCLLPPGIDLSPDPKSMKLPLLTESRGMDLSSMQENAGDSSSILPTGQGIVDEASPLAEQYPMVQASPMARHTVRRKRLRPTDFPDDFDWESDTLVRLLQAKKPKTKYGETTASYEIEKGRNDVLAQELQQLSKRFEQLESNGDEKRSRKVFRSLQARKKELEKRRATHVTKLAKLELSLQCLNYAIDHPNTSERIFAQKRIRSIQDRLGLSSRDNCLQLSLQQVDHTLRLLRCLGYESNLFFQSLWETPPKGVSLCIWASAYGSRRRIRLEKAPKDSPLRTRHDADRHHRLADYLGFPDEPVDA